MALTDELKYENHVETDIWRHPDGRTVTVRLIRHFELTKHGDLRHHIERFCRVSTPNASFEFGGPLGMRGVGNQWTMVALMLTLLGFQIDEQKKRASLDRSE